MAGCGPGLDRCRASALLARRTGWRPRWRRRSLPLRPLVQPRAGAAGDEITNTQRPQRHGHHLGSMLSFFVLRRQAWICVRGWASG